MATISTLAVNLIARTSVFEKNMKRSRKTMGTFKKSAASTAISVTAIAAAVATAAIAIRSFTNAASDAQETMNLFNTTFAENAAETAKWADSFATNIGRSKTEVKKWAATLQDTFVPLGFARDRAAELSKSLVELAVDVGSFKNIASDEEVINSFTSAIVGNHRAVRAYGVVLTNATIETAAFKAGINKTFADLTELEKVQLRYNIIMASTKDAQGDAAKTATNYANRVKKLKGQFTDLKELMGKELMPIMSRVIGFINNKGIPAFKNLARGFNVLIKFLQSNTVKYLAMATAIVWTVAKIKALIVVVKAIANSYRIFAIAQSVVLSLQGPKGWITLAVGIGVATAAIISLNAAMKETHTQANTVATSAKKMADAVEEGALRQEIARKEAFLERLKSSTKVGAGGKAKAIAFAEKEIRLSRMRLANAIQDRRVAQDVATTDKERLADQKRMLALSNEAVRLRASLLTPTEALIEREKLIDKLYDERLITIDEWLKAWRKLSDDRQALLDADKEDPLGEFQGGRFQEIRSEFVDVAALNAGKSERGIDKNNALTEKANFIAQQILTELKGNSQS